MSGVDCLVPAAIRIPLSLLWTSPFTTVFLYMDSPSLSLSLSPSFAVCLSSSSSNVTRLLGVFLCFPRSSLISFPCFFLLSPSLYLYLSILISISIYLSILISISSTSHPLERSSFLRPLLFAQYTLSISFFISLPFLSIVAC